jgi:hypothetical protein
METILGSGFEFEFEIKLRIRNNNPVFPLMAQIFIRASYLVGSILLTGTGTIFVG